MEGSESLRQRGSRAKPVPGTPSKESDSREDSSPAPKGGTTAEMAAGSARIIRYVLFAFFVGVYATHYQPLF